MPKNFQPLIDELRTVIETSRTGRLSPAEEQRGVSLFKELVLSGGKTLTDLLESLGDLPWFVPVTGTLEAWPNLTPAKRRNFLAALRPLESEPFRRVRFSIARGLYKIDPSPALALIVTTLQSIRKENGLQARDRQIVFSVLVGKNKPWLLQVDLASLKPADAQLVALSAIECSIGANPPSVVAVIQWAKIYQPLTTLSEPLQHELARTFKKWSSRWQKQLAQEELPSLVREALVEKLAKSANQPQEPSTPEQSAPEARPQAPAQRPRHPMGHQQRHHAAAKTQQVELGQRDRSQRQRLEKSPASRQKSIPDVTELLRHLQAHFNDLRDELQTVRKQLERAQPAPKQTGTHSIEAGKELVALRDENARLNETVTQLRETLSDLANDNFNEAVSRKADTEEPVTDPVEQYKSLLTLRVREQIVSFQTLNPDSRADGLPLLLDNILRTLQESGIDLTNIDAPPPPVRRRY
jgi:hypothetical protein